MSTCSCLRASDLNKWEQTHTEHQNIIQSLWNNTSYSQGYTYIYNHILSYTWHYVSIYDCCGPSLYHQKNVPSLKLHLLIIQNWSFSKEQLTCKVGWLYLHPHKNLFNPRVLSYNIHLFQLSHSQALKAALKVMELGSTWEAIPNNTGHPAENIHGTVENHEEPPAIMAIGHRACCLG